MIIKPSDKAVKVPSGKVAKKPGGKAVKGGKEPSRKEAANQPIAIQRDDEEQISEPEPGFKTGSERPGRKGAGGARGRPRLSSIVEEEEDEPEKEQEARPHVGGKGPSAYNFDFRGDEQAEKDFLRPRVGGKGPMKPPGKERKRPHVGGKGPMKLLGEEEGRPHVGGKGPMAYNFDEYGRPSRLLNIAFKQFSEL